MSVIKETRNTLNKLNESVSAYFRFASDLLGHPDAYVVRHFHSLISTLKKQKFKSISSNSPPKIEDVFKEWQKYLKSQNPTQKEILRMIRLGLSVLGLENEAEFRNFIKRQDVTPKLFKWLNSYVWRFQILNPEFNFKDDFWLELLEDWFFQISNSKLTIHNLLEKHSLLLDFEDYKAKKSHKAYFQTEAEKMFTLLENQKISDEALFSSILEITSNKFYLQFFPSDFFIDYILSKYFYHLLEKYLANRFDFDLFKTILYSFTNLSSRKGCERFIKLFKGIEWNINEREKREIKSFVKNKLGDPRINKSDWQILREIDENVYIKIRYWFNEQDFNLFFEFAFAGKADPHRRKECWQKYLYYADDLRIFLANQNEINKFKKLTETKDFDLLIKPILNHSTLTSLVIKIDRLLIFETVETGTAAYVYNINSIKSKASLSQNEKTLLNFFDIYFIKNLSTPIRLRDYFVFTDIVYDAKKDQASFRKSPHWRFSRSNQFWIESVESMMIELYGITPKTKEEIDHA